MSTLPFAFNIGMAFGVGLFMACARHGHIDAMLYRLDAWLRRFRN